MDRCEVVHGVVGEKPDGLPDGTEGHDTGVVDDGWAPDTLEDDDESGDTPRRHGRGHTP